MIDLTRVAAFKVPVPLTRWHANAAFYIRTSRIQPTHAVHRVAEDKSSIIIAYLFSSEQDRRAWEDELPGFVRELLGGTLVLGNATVNWVELGGKK